MPVCDVLRMLWTDHSWRAPALSFVTRTFAVVAVPNCVLHAVLLPHCFLRSVCACVCVCDPQEFYSLLLSGFAKGDSVQEMQAVLKWAGKSKAVPSGPALVAAFNRCVC